MTKDSLNRGLIIQEELNNLKSQLTYLNKSNNYLLKELGNPCTGKISEELIDLEDDAKRYIFKKLNDRIAKFEQEFKKL